MKKIYSILLTLAAAAFMAVSCQPEQAYEPGPKDVDGCYGVYFPSQPATGSHTFDPTMPTVQEFLVARTNSDDSIDVPYEVVDPKGIYECGPIHFDAGQKETTFEVKFDKAEMGVQYPLTISITDNQYASFYGDKQIAFDFSAFRVEWKYFATPSGEPAVINYTEGWNGTTGTAKIKYYEVDGVRTCVTESDPLEDGGKTYYGFWRNTTKPEEATELNFIWYTNGKCYGPDGEVYECIQVPEQDVEFNTNYGQMVKYYDYYAFWTILNPQAALVGMDYVTYCSKYSSNYQSSYYDGNGGFYFFCEYYYMIGLGGWSVDDFDPICIADGYTRTDYSIEAEAGYTVDGELPVYFTTGVDVNSVKFGAFEGQLTATQIANQVEAISNDKDGAFSVADEFVYDEENNVNLFAAAISELPATGEYTIVAVSFDEAGKAQGNTSIVAKYVAAGDEDANAVKLSLGIGSAEKYPGVNTDSSLETWVYGQNIVDAKIAVFKYIDLVSSVADCQEKLMATESVTEDVIAAINGEGYVSVVDKLLPGTEYYLMIWASNGYEQDFFLSSTSAITSGDPLPIYKEYTLADLDESLLDPDPASMAGKTFNYYGTDYFGKLGMNEYLGKVSISEVTKHISDPAGDTNLVDVKGLYNYDDNAGVFEDVVEFDFCDGVLYHSSKKTKDEKANFYTMNAAGSAYNTTYFMGFIPVLDGYYAYVCLDPTYYAQYGWCGFGYYAGGGFWGFVTNAILVDPEKDDNGLAPAKSAKLSSVVTMAINNALLCGQKNMFSKVEKSMKLYNSFRVVDGVCPANQVKISTRNIAPKAQQSQNIDKNNITRSTSENIAF
ncbi:MAG: hypothetical protein MJY73_01430 [Bacteroidales bacterium]|nr:hypothetical protein [Bacteroidales bacterium]